ncbi:MAG: hypothetical protein ACR2F6_06450 [Mycobacteriales bacterium]
MLFILGVAFAIALLAVLWSLVREQRLHLPHASRAHTRVAARHKPGRAATWTNVRALRRSKDLSVPASWPKSSRRPVAPDDDQDFLDELSRRAHRDDPNA